MTTNATIAPRRCTTCDTAIPPAARYCVTCGAPARANVGATTRITPVATTQGRVCTHCANANPTGAAFCVNCGSALATPSRYAPGFVGSFNTTLVQQVYLTNPLEPIPLIVRALWFVFIGLWLGPLWIVFGWLLNLTIIGMPLGVWMLNRTGNVMTLRRAALTPLPAIAQSSASFAVRSVYFVLIGWWASLLWLLFGWVAAVTVIGLPIAFLMFERTGTVMTLAEV